MAFTTNMSGATQLADRLITIYDNEFIVSAEGTLTKGLPSLATQKRSGKAKTWSFTIYSKLTVQTSALTEDTDPTSEAMADTAVTITPAEYGNVVTPTALIRAQSGGMVDIAAVRLTALNMAESIEKKMILVGEAGSNELIVAANEASLAAGNVITAAYVKQAFSKLRTSGIPGPYIAVAHPHVIFDLQAATGTQGWTEISNYADPQSILRNEIGMFGGFRWIESPLVTINADAGAGAVDSYHTQFFGYNAFGYSESQVPGGVMTSSDKLARFVNVGWFGIYEFGIIDSNAHWLVTSASAMGANT